MQEPPFPIPSTTSAQILIETLVDSFTKVDTTIRIDIVEQRQTTIEEKETKNDQPNAQTQGASQIIVIDQRRYEESKDTPKEKEKEAIQALVTLPTSCTPTKVIQKMSTEAIPLQISAPRSGSSKVSKVIHYGDVTLDEEIVIPKYDYATITL